MEDFKKRLLEFARARYDMGQSKFEDYCELNRGTISAIKVHGPTASIIMKISIRCPELNLNWLFRGDAGGHMLNETQKDKESPMCCPSPTNVIQDNNVVIIGNWSELGDIVERAILNAMSNK